MIGAFGENFPYSNFHDLNLDWIIKVMKDFFNKYPSLLEEVEKKLNKPVTDPNGELDDILASNGDGSTKWIKFATVYAPVIIDAVNQWMADHPDVTTTVQDGSISPAKLNTELYNLYKLCGKTQFFFPSLEEGVYSSTSALMVTPHKTVLFDADDIRNATPVMQYYNDLYSAGVFSNIDYIVISHYHNDHIGLLENILQSFPHNNCTIYMALSPSGYYAGAQDSYLITNYNNVLALAEEYFCTAITVDTDRTITIDEGITIQLLNSNNDAYSYYSDNQVVYNNYSMVALVNTGNLYSMFPGDLETAGQRWLNNIIDLPRLFLYCVHHHSIQNDDYIPYIYKLDPQYNVITTSHNRQIVSAGGSMFVKLTDGNVGSTAYGSYSFVCDGKTGSITYGRNIPNEGWNLTSIILYVDNSYDGAVHDGTEIHPFTTINEALMFVRDNKYLRYTLNIAGGSGTSVYANGMFRDIQQPIAIQGVDNPEIESLYIHNSEVRIRNLSIVGGYAGYPDSSTKNSAIVALDADITLNNVTMDGTDVTNSYIMSLENSKVSINSCAISNYGKGIVKTTSVSGALENSVVSITNTAFTDIPDLFYMDRIKFILYEGNTFGTPTYILHGDPESEEPAFVSREYMTSAFANLSTAHAVSEPIYVSADLPCAMMSNKKIYNLLTGLALE